MLDIDDLVLLPQDNFAWFNAGGGLGSGARLMDDSFARESYMLIDGQQLRGHERVGTWLELPAGARSWFFCFLVNANGIAFVRLRSACGPGFEPDDYYMDPMEMTGEDLRWYFLPRRKPVLLAGDLR